MDYEFEMEKPFIVTTADMLEIAASGANGSEYVDIVGLMENAAKELREKDAEIERLREALREIYEVYAGSEGIPQPMTAAEGYLLSLFMEAVRIAQEARRRKTDGYC